MAAFSIRLDRRCFCAMSSPSALGFAEPHCPRTGASVFACWCSSCEYLCILRGADENNARTAFLSCQGANNDEAEKPVAPFRAPRLRWAANALRAKDQVKIEEGDRNVLGDTAGRGILFGVAENKHVRPRWAANTLRAKVAIKIKDEQAHSLMCGTAGRGVPFRATETAICGPDLAATSFSGSFAIQLRRFAPRVVSNTRTWQRGRRVCARHCEGSCRAECGAGRGR